MPGHPIMIPVLLTPEEIQYVLMILTGMENLHDHNRNQRLREVLGMALRNGEEVG